MDISRFGGLAHFMGCLFEKLDSVDVAKLQMAYFHVPELQVKKAAKRDLGEARRVVKENAVKIGRLLLDEATWDANECALYLQHVLPALAYTGKLDCDLAPYEKRKQNVCVRQALTYFRSAIGIMGFDWDLLQDKLNIRVTFEM